MSKRGWLLFAAMAVIWGIPYLLIKIALEGMPAPFIVFARTAVGAAVLLPVAMKRDLIRPALKHWRYIAVFAALEIAGPWLLLGDAEQHMTSSLAGLLIAAVPFFVALIMWRLGEKEAVSGTRLAGLFIGLAGVIAIVGLNIGEVNVWHMLEVIAVAIGYAIAPIIANRRLSDVPTLGVITLSLTGVALLYTPVAAFTLPAHLPKANAIAAAVALGLVCTAAAFLLFFALIAEAGPARASMITFVNPAVAVAGGVVFLGETIKAGVIVGFPLVMIGLVLSTLRTPEAGAAEAGPAVEAAPALDEAVVVVEAAPVTP
ncbi:DMT family transporter [Catenulispora yoronensis]|uniref:DMT family transporter n=1 Tax=Catenulispora yoronensis TaxID=450799 RepID=A0ABN2VBQ2_9ACTN